MNVTPEIVTLRTNGIRLDALLAGPPEGRPVVLLHGFPETRDSWRRQVEPLARAGFRVLAPDQRGYAGSDKPLRVADYALDRLASDVIGLFDSQGWPRAAVVGHDWGGIVAWWAALTHPDRVDRLVAINAPHPVSFRRYLATHPAQWLRSWYVLSFQVPRLPEMMLRRDDWRPLRRALIDTSRPGTFSEEVLAGYRAAWSRPGAIRSMLHWYRASLRHAPKPPADVRVRAPTMILWGPGDRFLGRGCAAASLDLCADGRIAWIEGASHWVHHEEPDRVNRLLLDFLAEPGGSE